jgi:hypothetical protein
MSIGKQIIFPGLINNSSCTVTWDGYDVLEPSYGLLEVEAFSKTGQPLSSQSLFSQSLIFTAESTEVKLSFNTSTGGTMLVLNSLKIVPDVASASTCKPVERKHVEMRANFTEEMGDCALRYTLPVGSVARV